MAGFPVHFWGVACPLVTLWRLLVLFGIARTPGVGRDRMISVIGRHWVVLRYFET